MATATAESNLPAIVVPPESNTGSVTRPVDEIEDPYIWKPAGAFGLQAVQAKTQTPAPPAQPAKSQPVTMAQANNAYEALWRWRDFAAGVAVGALSIIAFSMVYKLERR